MPTLIPIPHLVPWSAFTHTVWQSVFYPITRAEVRQALADNCLHSGNLDNWLRHNETVSALEHRNTHVRRVAYLVANPDPEPISLDVGIPHMRCYVSWPVVDGNHRLAAALFRRESYIWAEVSGSADYARELLGVDI